MHVVGYELNGGIRVAKYWKNGIGTDLTDGTDHAEAFSVFVSGPDVYVAGYDSGSAVCWKNGIATILSDGACALLVFVSGSDVYVAGWEGERIYWKNGIDRHKPNGWL